MGLLGVVSTFAMWLSDGFDSHILHHMRDDTTPPRQNKSIQYTYCELYTSVAEK